MVLGIAYKNPYDGIGFGKINLWTWDHYRASTYGYYLQALVVFGNLTGVNPRSLGENECSGYELGMSRYEVKMLQQTTFKQLASDSRVKDQAQTLQRPTKSMVCLPSKNKLFQHA